MSKDVSNSIGFTRRAVALGVMLCSLYTIINAYIGINFGMGFGFSTVTVILAYMLFHKLLKGTSKKEVALTVIVSSWLLPAHWALGFLIFLRENVPEAEFPQWVVPSNDVIGVKQLSPQPWLLPIATQMFLMLTGALSGMLIAYAAYRKVLENRRMVFPFYEMDATVINSALKGGGPAKLLGISIITATALTVFQYALGFFGVEATLLDFTPLLPKGFLYGLTLNIAFIAIGYIISPPVAISVLIGSLVSYTIITPMIVSQGIITYSAQPMELYMNAVQSFLISPALGLMLLGGAFLSVFKLVKSKRVKEKTNSSKTGEEKLGYSELYKACFSSILWNRRLLALFLTLTASQCLFAYLLNPMYPCHPFTSVAITLFCIIVSSFLDFVIIVKMAGETGMSAGIHEFFLYNVPILATGYRGYTAYFAMPKGINPWIGTSMVGYTKIKDKLDLDLKSIVKAMLISFVPSFVVSVIFVLMIWKVVGFCTPEMPCISFIQTLPFTQMFAERRATGIIDWKAFAIGGLAGAAIEGLTPASIMGLAIGMILPPYYGLPFGIGGILRLYMDRKYGKEHFERKGMIAASGILAGGLLAQVIMSMIKSCI